MGVFLLSLHETRSGAIESCAADYARSGDDPKPFRELWDDSKSEASDGFNVWRVKELEVYP